ncbi:uncharacterized protein LOC132162639 [Corylus avellana]|uniref:uncharacterized protein LOC132162639 n=1 Tax=Corylus avellana TaxID=13451 RepID=UPI00286A9229|nr:uncharacterized protein LOC132162639 [Corylus avellana]
MHEINYLDEEINIPVLEHVSRKAKGCRLCEEYMTQTLDYLAENKTQAMVFDNLHDLCSGTGSLRQECITLVDHYVPIFFLEASSVQPEEFCRGYHLCQQFEMGSQIDEITDGICKRAVSSLLSELKDPESQLQIIQSLFQACRFSNSVENHAVKCKRMVLMYGPQLLAEAVNFLETSDMCSTLDACKFTARSMEISVPHQEQSLEKLDS